MGGCVRARGRPAGGLAVGQAGRARPRAQVAGLALHTPTAPQTTARAPQGHDLERARREAADLAHAVQRTSAEHSAARGAAKAQAKAQLDALIAKCVAAGAVARARCVPCDPLLMLYVHALLLVAAVALLLLLASSCLAQAAQVCGAVRRARRGPTVRAHAPPVGRWPRLTAPWGTPPRAHERCPAWPLSAWR